MKHMLLCAGVALGLSLSVAISGHAFSVGEIKVQSYLNTPFVAEVPLILKPHERGQGLVAVIGDAKDYQSEGVNRTPVIETLRPSIIMGQADVIRIISTEPIDVAAFDLLLLVRTGKVTIVQNYPVTLTASPRSAPIVAEAAPPAPLPAKPALPEKIIPLAKTIPPAPVPPVPVPKTKRTPRPESPISAGWLANMPVQYGPILRGEALYKVMKRLRVPKPYIWPVAVRIWEHNRERFVRGNLHGLRIGAYLEIPDDLGGSLPALSRREAEQTVAAQWEEWQKPSQMTAASAAVKPLDKVRSVKAAPAKPAAPSAEAVVFSAKTDMNSAVNMATLESMLQGFEKRLAQRLSLPVPTDEALEEHTITFVSTDDLQTAIQGLEARLLRQLEARSHLAGAWRDDAASRQPALRAGMETAVASFLSADSFIYVFVGQNVILLLIAAGAAWRWYRKRA